MTQLVTLVSVDLDDVACYHAIHGLGSPTPGSARLVLERCLPRFLALFDELGARSTFFVIGRDLAAAQAERSVGVTHLRRAATSGHELANHSHAHAYDLSRWSEENITHDLAQAHEELRALGVRPIGFRAPGYTESAALRRAVEALGYRYDASELPSWPYYAAKVGAIAGARVLGRDSASLLRGARSFLGPTLPTQRPSGVWSVPISATPRLRLPFVGTFLLAGPRPVRHLLARASQTAPYLHLELHGLDLADARDGYDRDLIPLRPEFRVSLAERTERLRRFLAARGPVTAIRDFVDDPSLTRGARR